MQHGRGIAPSPTLRCETPHRKIPKDARPFLVLCVEARVAAAHARANAHCCFTTCLALARWLAASMCTWQAQAMRVPVLSSAPVSLVLFPVHIHQGMKPCRIYCTRTQTTTLALVCVVAHPTKNTNPICFQYDNFHDLNFIILTNLIVNITKSNYIAVIYYNCIHSDS